MKSQLPFQFRLNRAIAPLLILALMTLGNFTVSGQSTQFPAYAVGVAVHNLADEENACSVKVYAADGTVTVSSGVSLRPADSASVFPIAYDPLADDSLVITCALPYAVTTNLLASDFRAGGSYLVPNTGDTVVYLPLLNQENSGYTTWYTLQNLGAEEATVNVIYSDGTTAGPVAIPAFSARSFFQAEEPHGQTVFSAVVLGNQPMRAAVIQESSDIIFAYTGIPSTAGGTIPPPAAIVPLAEAAATEYPVFPLVNANNSGYVTGIQIQNSGDEATEVTVSYTPSEAGQACTETRPVGAGASATFSLAAFANGAASNCAAGERFIGSAAVTGNSMEQPLTGIVNQLLPGVNGEAYVGFAPDEATNIVAMPLIMDRNSGYFTGFSLRHVGGPPSEIICTFTNTDYTVERTLGEGEALVDIQHGQIADGYVGSGRCEAANPATKIVAVVNELNQTAGGDQLLIYEGVPVWEDGGGNE